MLIREDDPPRWRLIVRWLEEHKAEIERVQVVDADGETIVAVRRSGLTPEQKRRLALYDNRAGELAEWDAEVLAEFDGELLDGLWSDAELGELLAGVVTEEPPEDPGPQADRAEELQGKWGTAVGQWWSVVGEEFSHSLFVGPAQQASLEGDFALYDPPFDWSARQQETALSWCRWRKTLLMWLHYCMPLVARSDFLHWWVWDSGMARFGGAGYKPMSGCAIMLAFGEKRMWYEAQALSVLDSYGIDHYDWPIQVVKIQDHLSDRESGAHQKPLALFEYCVALYSQRGMTVIDPFAGSGSVLVACERLGREYHGAEVDPSQAALMLERASEMGLDARLSEHG